MCTHSGRWRRRGWELRHGMRQLWELLGLEPVHQGVHERRVAAAATPALGEEPQLLLEVLR
jgi:hypothetical protein